MIKPQRSLYILLIFTSIQTLVAQPVTDPAMITSVNGSEQGYVLFQERCMSCHGKPEMEQAPSPETLRRMSAERIYAALSSGAMQVHARDLPDQQIRWVAEAVSGQSLDNAMADASSMPNQCADNPEPALHAGDWSGWSNDTSNKRIQHHSDINTENFSSLELKWAFGFKNGVSAFSQPAIAGTHLYVGSDTGYVYALDTESGCVHWSYKALSNVRTTPVFGKITKDEQSTSVIFFGDLKSNIYALDAHTGEELWQVKGDDEISARVTASPVFYEGKLYVPMSSWEEAAARAVDYPCCTFRGSMSAYDAQNGELLWKTYTLEEPEPTKINSAGVQLFAPAGASIWNVPIIDPSANALYFGTGDAFTYPAPETSDAVIALDLDTGKTLWTYQVFADDAFLVGCGAAPSENCPEVLGPDNDIPASLILTELEDKKRAIIVPTRTGEILSLDPDREGALNWKVNASTKTGSGGGMLWGGAADNRKVYFGLTSGGMIATDYFTGETTWYNPLTKEDQPQNSGAAASLVNDIVLIGGIDGVVHALSTEDGAHLWSYATVQNFETVNDIPARGGSVTAAGPIATRNRLFISSGYQVIYGIPGNVLLAFGLPDQ